MVSCRCATDVDHPKVSASPIVTQFGCISASPLRHFLDSFSSAVGLLCYSRSLSPLQCICPLQGLTTLQVGSTASSCSTWASPFGMYIFVRQWPTYFELKIDDDDAEMHEARWIEYLVDQLTTILTHTPFSLSSTIITSPLPVRASSSSSWLLWTKGSSLRFGLKGSSTVRHVL